MASQTRSRRSYLDIFALLKIDHETLMLRFHELINAPKQDVNLRTRLFSELHRVLENHAELEDQLVYPALAGENGSERWAVKASAQHEKMRELVREMETYTARDREWNMAIRRLRKECERHIAMEEKEIFPRLEAILKPVERKRLAYRFRRAQETLTDLQLPAA